MSELISTRKDLHILKNEINLSPYVNSPYSCCAMQKYSKSAVGLLAQRWCLFLKCAHPTALAPGGHETGSLSVQGLSIPHGIIRYWHQQHLLRESTSIKNSQAERSASLLCPERCTYVILGFKPSTHFSGAISWHMSLLSSSVALIAIKHPWTRFSLGAGHLLIGNNCLQSFRNSDLVDTMPFLTL